MILPARRLAPNGFDAWKDVLRANYEGLVAKDPASPYVGGRTLKWLKVKQREPGHRAGLKITAARRPFAHWLAARWGP